ncbi:hypothetical protein Bhyg_17053 [Pseudolycoriella hygida]|uniref:Uncharacterized protein n=1 Tax=Pseudolycoriella hygida TaxID=35572 RepID=A0A9Q0MLS1_9DIPT|nr:hypothetical protein Bhyg_17053 [Pseudolycoriella hygida]
MTIDVNVMFLTTSVERSALRFYKIPL